MSTMYVYGKQALLSGQLSLVSDTVNVSLLKSDYTPAQTEQVWSDISAHLATASTATVALANKAVTPDTTSGMCVFNADDVTFTGVNDTVGGVAVYESAGTLIAYFGFSPLTLSGGDLQISWNVTGILEI